VDTTNSGSTAKGNGTTPVRPPGIRTVKLADFGLAAICKSGQKLSTQCGSMPFASPELMHSRSYCGFKCDVWSSGVVCLEIVCKLNKFEKMMNWPRDGTLLASSERAIEVERKFSCCGGASFFKDLLIRDESANDGSPSMSMKGFQADGTTSSKLKNDTVDYGGAITTSQRSSNHGNHSVSDMSPAEIADVEKRLQELRISILSDLNLNYVKRNSDGVRDLLHLLLGMILHPKPNKRCTMTQVAASSWLTAPLKLDDIGQAKS